MECNQAQVHSFSMTSAIDSPPRKCGLSANKVDLPLTKITFDRNFP
ncbi:MAG: hypothetical protein HN692_06590 [Candidatus Cloacimonetes bacterium]|jgi:hypothetical protein|nr:hypothetical protein [Candidatus Cloacimonadota bacterium]